jgi:hypothetical protein
MESLVPFRKDARSIVVTCLAGESPIIGNLAPFLDVPAFVVFWQLAAKKNLILNSATIDFMFYRAA